MTRKPPRLRIANDLIELEGTMAYKKTLEMNELQGEMLDLIRELSAKQATMITVDDVRLCGICEAEPSEDPDDGWPVETHLTDCLVVRARDLLKRIGA